MLSFSFSHIESYYCSNLIKNAPTQPVLQEELESTENIKVCKITAEQRSEMSDKIEEAQEQILEKSGDGKQKL